MNEHATSPDGPPVLTGAMPQLYATDIARAETFFHALGFATEYLWGEPPFYGLVRRDHARINLRHVDRLPVDAAMRDGEQLLSAVVPVENVKALYGEYADQGIDFVQTLTLQPWGAEDFIVADPDGNLICFAQAV